MWILVGTLVIIICLMYGSMLYKTRVIQDYENRLPREYQAFVDILNKLKAYLELEDRASREPYMRGLINESICKYARRCRTGIDDVIEDNEEKFATIKKD